MDEKRLRSVPLFAGLGKRERREVAKLIDEIDIPAGRVLAREGEIAYQFFLIEQGSAEVSQNGEAVGQLGPGDYFGEIGVLGTERRTATVTASSDMELAVLTDFALRSLNREQPEIGRQLRETIEQRLAEDEGRRAGADT